MDTKRLFNYSVIGGILLISFSIFYYFVIFLPDKEKARQKLEEDKQYQAELEIRRKENQFESCIELAQEHYHANWELRCKNSGKKEGCELPRYLYDDLQEDYNKAQELCVKKYK